MTVRKKIDSIASGTHSRVSLAFCSALVVATLFGGTVVSALSTVSAEALAFAQSQLESAETAPSPVAPSSTAASSIAATSPRLGKRKLSDAARAALFNPVYFSGRHDRGLLGGNTSCPDDYPSNQILVRFDESVPEAQALEILGNLGSGFQYTFSPISPLGLYLIVAAEEDTAQGLLDVMGLIDIRWMFELDCPGEGTRTDDQRDHLELEVSASLDIRGTDTYSGEQWHLDRISARDAWSITTGSEEVVVAIVDSGYDLDNGEFDGRIFESEDDPVNGADDEGDGYQDDISGWDFVAYDETSEDEHNHGTWVSGIWGASSGNGFGVEGVDHKARLAPLRILDKSNFGFTSSLVGAMDYALLHPDIRVVNLSLINFPFGDSFIAASVEALVTQAIIVGCSGNSGEGTADGQYPGAHPAVISVAWTDDTDAIAAQSSSGSTVEFSAPGKNVVTLKPTLGVPEFDDRSIVSGCSFATPQVAGAASLTLSIRPHTDQSDFRFLLKRSVEDLGPEGWDENFGWGLLNVEQVLMEAEELVFQGGFETGDLSRWDG